MRGILRRGTSWSTRAWFRWRLDLVELDSLESDSTLPDTDPSELDLSDDGGSLSLSEDGLMKLSEDTAPSLGEIDLDDSEDELQSQKLKQVFPRMKES